LDRLLLEDGELPKDETGSDSTPRERSFASETGLLLSLDDDAKTITLSDSDGNNLLKFTMQSGQIKMQAKTKVIVEAPQIELVESARTRSSSAMTCSIISMIA